MRFVPTMLCGALLTTLAVFAPNGASAVNIVVNFDFDSNRFFNPATTNGQQARAALQAAAGYYSDILDDTFSRIQTPAPYASQSSSGVQTWNWNLTFSDPAAANQPISLDNVTIPQNEYRIYAGGRSLSGDTLGVGGPGGFGVSSGGNGGFFSSQEIDQINQITTDFFDAVQTRGESSGFSSWGGAVTFDTDISANWHFNHTAPPPGNRNDFFSTAFHELGHALGLGTSEEWNSLITGTTFSNRHFFGPAAVADHGGPVPINFKTITGVNSPDDGHWLEGTQSTVFDTSTTQEAAMDPTLLQGTRKLVTSLDAAALTDIGWTVIPPPSLSGDYNDDGVVDAADYTVWRDALGSATALLNDDTPGVAADDYTWWKNNFGQSAAAGASLGTSQAVPEPATGWILFAGLLAVASRFRPPS